MNIIEKLKNSFIDEGVEINPSASIVEVEKLEEKYGVKFPAILKDYFLLFNGTGQGNFGKNGFAFFSLAEFKPVNEELGKNNPEQEAYLDHFVFSDYLVWCWGYAVNLNNQGLDGPVFLVADVTLAPRKVANSFAEFLEIYLSNSDDLI